MMKRVKNYYSHSTKTKVRNFFIKQHLNHYLLVYFVIVISLIGLIFTPLSSYAATDTQMSQNAHEEGCLFTAAITATRQVIDIENHAYVEFGLEPNSVTTINPDNWSEDFIVRLQLIDALAEDMDITDPNTFTEAHYLEKDIREPSGQIGIAWYVMVETLEEGDPNASVNHPVFSWSPNDLVCDEYQVRRGLDTGGEVLIDNMADTNSYQTVSQDGGLIKYFTILWKQESDSPNPPQKPSRQILPWPGVFQGALGWVGFPMTGGFPGGLPVPARSGYPSGLSIPSFPGTYIGFTYPGGMSPAWTPFVPRFPATFPTLGIFSPVGRGWHGNYWTGYPHGDVYKTGWFYKH